MKKIVNNSFCWVIVNEWTHDDEAGINIIKVTNDLETAFDYVKKYFGREVKFDEKCSGIFRGTIHEKTELTDCYNDITITKHNILY